jgi:hypothetical protein
MKNIVNIYGKFFVHIAIENIFTKICKPILLAGINSANRNLKSVTNKESEI